MKNMYIPIPELEGKNIVAKEDIGCNIGIIKKNSVWKIREAKKYNLENETTTSLVGVEDGTIFVSIESLDVMLPFLPTIQFDKDLFRMEA